MEETPDQQNSSDTNTTHLDTSDLGQPNRKRVFLPIAIILAIAIGSLMTIKANVHKEAKLNSQPIELVEGAQIPDLEMNKLEGGSAQIASLPHKVMMINFWATWCEACMSEMPSIVTLRDTFAPKGFEVLGVNVDENPAQVVPEIQKKMGIKFPIFTDKNNLLAEMFDVHAIPLTVIINKDRKILLIESGERDWNGEDLHQMLEKWLSE